MATYGGDTITVHPDDPINPDASVGGATGDNSSQYNLPYHSDALDGTGLYPSTTTNNATGSSPFDEPFTPDASNASNSPSTTPTGNGSANGQGGSGGGSGSGSWPVLLGEMASRISVMLLGVLLLIMGLVWAMQRNT